MPIAAEVNLITRDADLPGLKLVLNPDRLRTTLQRQSPRVHLGEIYSTYLRYRPGKHCLVAYRLQVDNQWIDLYAKAVHRQDMAKLSQGQHSSIPGVLGEGRQVWGRTATMMASFPNDGKLRGLPHLTTIEDSPEHCLQLLPRQSPEGTLVTLSYKPERSYTAQWLVAEQPQAIVKAYTQSRFAIAVANCQRLQSRGLLRLAAPLAYSDRRRLISYEWLNGGGLSPLLADSVGDRAALTAVGHALADFHAQPAPLVGINPMLIQIKRVMALTDWVQFVLPELQPLLETIRTRLVEQLNQLPALYQPIHGDCHAERVLVMPDAIALLNLDHATVGDPALDLGNFMAHLERQCLYEAHPQSQLDLIQTQLLTGYRAVSDIDLEPRISVYTALGLLALAPEPFRYRKANWPDQMTQILERVAQLVRPIARRQNCLMYPVRSVECV